jgi:adiponectin receptor
MTVNKTFARTPFSSRTSSGTITRRRRRVSTSYTGHRLVCRNPLPHSLNALDLSFEGPNSPALPSLVNLRIAVLSYLADLETRLALFAAGEVDSDASSSEDEASSEGSSSADGASFALEDARAWAQDGLEMLAGIRDDVCASLPAYDFHLPAALEDARDHFFADMHDLRTHAESLLPDMPQLPDLGAASTKLRSSIAEFDFATPMSYVPKLSAHLERLQQHVARAQCFPGTALELPSFAPSGVLAELLDRLATSEFVGKYTGDAKEEDSLLERATKDLAKAMKTSMHGAKLIAYNDLPAAWRGNPFVMSGYR